MHFGLRLHHCASSIGQWAHTPLDKDHSSGPNSTSVLCRKCQWPFIDSSSSQFHSNGRQRHFRGPWMCDDSQPNVYHMDVDVRNFIISRIREIVSNWRMAYAFCAQSSRKNNNNRFDSIRLVSRKEIATHCTPPRSIVFMLENSTRVECTTHTYTLTAQYGVLVCAYSISFFPDTHETKREHDLLHLTRPFKWDE